MNSNLPPGCTVRDLDIATGAIRSCADCGKDVEVQGDEDDDQPILCICCVHQDDDYERWRDDQHEKEQPTEKPDV